MRSHRTAKAIVPISNELSPLSIRAKDSQDWVRSKTLVLLPPLPDNRVNIEQVQKLQSEQGKSSCLVEADHLFIS